MEMMKGDAFSEVSAEGRTWWRRRWWVARAAALSRDALLHEGTRLITEARRENRAM